MPDAHESSRDAAEAFGDGVEEAAAAGGRAIDALHGRTPPPQKDDTDAGDGDITININQ